MMWKDDVEAANIRLQTLMAIFGPSLSEAEMSAIVTRFPMLLSMEEEKITQAVATLQREVPFVDPAFLLRQNAPGIELLVTCVGSERYTPHTHSHTHTHTHTPLCCPRSESAQARHLVLHGAACQPVSPAVSPAAVPPALLYNPYPHPH
jgi:hypothetical protein